MKNKSIPKKNYLFLFLLVVGVVGLTFYLASWYKTIDDYYENNSILSKVVAEIDSETFSSFLLDNPDTVVYISSSADASVKGFEKQFKKMIVDNNLTNNIYYFDINKEINEDGLTILYDKYVSSTFKKKISKVVAPNLVRFKSGEIVDVMYYKNYDITKKDVQKFLDRNELLNND